VKVDDFIALDCTPNIEAVGVSEVVRALAAPARFPHLSGFDRMRQRVGDNIVSLAFRRYLDAQKIPYQLTESLNFTQLDWSDITFGGRRCVPFAQLICSRPLIQRVHQNPELILSEHLYLPEGAPAAGYRDVDIYLFVHLTTLVTRSRGDIEKAIVAGQPVFLVYQMPDVWAAPAQWRTLDPLVLKTDLSEDLTLDMHGQDQRRGYLSDSVELPGRQRVEVSPGFFTLGALRAASLPSGPVGLHSETVDDTLLVAPFQWGNIRLYKMRMHITGYITQADFFRHASKVSGQTARRVNPCLQQENLLSVPVAELKPPQDLFVRAANWAQMKKK
jgi:hypothetical protein